MALTAKQARFAQEYIIDLNATQAAVRAGYSKKTAEVQANQLMKQPLVQAAISEAINARSNRTQIDADRVLVELGRLGFSDLRDLFTENGDLRPIGSWSDDAAAAVSSVEVVVKPIGNDGDGNKIVEHIHKIRLWDKNAALEKIAKHLGMFIEKHEHKVNVTLEDLITKSLYERG
jgi:phage terminase small subunit